MQLITKTCSVCHTEFKLDLETQKDEIVEFINRGCCNNPTCITRNAEKELERQEEKRRELEQAKIDEFKSKQEALVASRAILARQEAYKEEERQKLIREKNARELAKYSKTLEFGPTRGPRAKEKEFSLLIEGDDWTPSEEEIRLVIKHKIAGDNFIRMGDVTGIDKEHLRKVAQWCVKNGRMTKAQFRNNRRERGDKLKAMEMILVGATQDEVIAVTGVGKETYTRIKNDLATLKYALKR